MVETLFSSETPTITDQGEVLAGLTLATAFYPTVDGTVPGVRRYKATTPPDSTAIGLLYSVSNNGAGVELARADFDDNTSPWAVAMFASPVPVMANTLYLAAYWVVGPTVHYVAQGAFFAADLVSGHLVGIQSGTNPTGLAGNIDNGRFVAGAAPAFPTGTFNSIGYWADPLFDPAASDIAGEGHGGGGAFGLGAGLKLGRGTATGLTGSHGAAAGAKQARGAGVLAFGWRGQSVGSKSAAGIGAVAAGARGVAAAAKQAHSGGLLPTAATGLDRAPAGTGAPARGDVTLHGAGTVNLVDNRPGVTLR